MNWNNYLPLIFIISMVALLTFGVVAYLSLRSEGLECIADPFAYTVKFTQDKLNSDLTCSCNLLNEKYTPFTFDKEGIKPIENGDVRQTQAAPNFSSFNITLRG